MTKEIKQINGFRVVTFHSLQQTLGKELFDEYYAWLENNPLVYNIQVNSMLSDTIIHVEKFLKEKNIDYSAVTY